MARFVLQMAIKELSSGAGNRQLSFEVEIPDSPEAADAVFYAHLRRLVCGEEGDAEEMAARITGKR